MLHLRLTAFALVISGTVAYAAAPVPNALLHSLFDPGTNPQPRTQQGWSVAVDGNLVVVGIPSDTTGIRQAGTVKVFEATTGNPLYTIPNPNPSAGEFFGYAVAISGTRVVIGANWDKGGTNLTGSAIGCAYVYELAGATPTLPVLTLTNPNPTSGLNLFAHSVAISGTLAVIGGPGDDRDGVDTGVAYVCDLGSVTPDTPTLVLRNPSPAVNEGFGVTVAISGTRVVVATPWDGTGATYAGSAYVFDLNGPTPTTPVYTLNNPNPAANDQFGYAVAVEGKWVVVGANQDDTLVTDAGTAYVYDLTSATPTLPATTLNSPSPAVGDNFGYSVAISGTLVVIGAVYDDTGATNAGSAYVYDLASATPNIPKIVLNNPSPMTNDNFANAVAISGTRVVVGSPYDDIGVTDSGGAYVYELTSEVPALPRTILIQPSLAYGDFFGRAVAVSGTRVVVGADGDDTGATGAGRAYVYDLASATPNVPVLALNNPSPTEGDLFGWSVAISGTRVAIGAYRDDTGALNAGIVYVYDLGRPSPSVPILTLTNPTPAVADGFGATVAISDTRLVVGALFDDTGATNAGSAYVYDLAGVTPARPIVTLNNPTPAVNDLFGAAVAISGTRVIVGAYQDDTGAPDAGSAYVYDLTSVTPSVPIITLNNPYASGKDEDLFGYSVAISGTRVVVGAYRASSDRGSAHVYELAGATPTVPIANLGNPHTNPFDREDFAWSVAISGNRVLVGAPRTDIGALDDGVTYLYDLTSPTPAIPVATLTNPNPAASDYFGSAVAIDGATIVAGAYNDDTTGEDRGAVYVFGLQPALTISPTQPGFARISWAPTTSSGFALQYTDSLSPTNWLDAPSGAANPATISATNASRFYRLFQP